MRSAGLANQLEEVAIEPRFPGWPARGVPNARWMCC